ncbi:MAG: 2-oxo acid dehydrogenase subunit E2 [Acidimicrobiia bacterium]|nr:2-oxo acid dehydrogenase subunit E2 [Acidimicrobiia bacterium]
MATTVTMPQLGETVTEGTILSWAKKPGEPIAADEVLFEVSTDKVDTEVPSPVSGTVLEILVDEGVTVPVGTPLIVIGEAGEEPAPAGAAPPAPPESVPVPEPGPVPQPAPVFEPVPVSSPGAEEPAAGAKTRADFDATLSENGAAAKFLSPVVRKLAKEHNLDLNKIAGSGRAGRITRSDVLELIDAAGRAAPTARPAAAAPALASAGTAASAASVGSGLPIPVMEGDDVRDLDRIRTRIGTNMILAKRTAAHVWTSVEVDYEPVERVRQRHRTAFKEREGFSLTYMPFVARATMDALKAFPVVNSSYYLEEKKAVFHTKVNLGVAVDLDQGGLVVATIHDADGLRMIGLARQIRDLATKARAGNLEPDDVAGSTFTITNPGPFGSFMSAPIINVPNTGILSTDTVAKRPTVITSEDGQDMIAIRHIGYLGLTWDHRAFDGSTAVLFLRKIKESLETWDWEQELN